MVINHHTGKDLSALANFEDAQVYLLGPSSYVGAVKSAEVIINGLLLDLKSLYNLDWEKM